MLTGKADCGLGYAVKRSGKAVAYCSLSIRCGTRSEGVYPEGIAHFVEHTIFKGTEKRSAAQISSRLDSLGGELNAYTTKEEIVLHATVLKEDIWKAADLLLELACKSVFPQKEIDTERGVVIEEIKSYKDSPADDVYDNFEEMLFAGHPLGRKILGTAASVRRIRREDLLGFVHDNFVPGKMVLSLVADLPEEVLGKKACRLAEEYFGSSPCNDASGFAGCEPTATQFCKTVDKRNHEVNAVIGAVAPSLYEEDRIATVLLAGILGGPGSNSLLNRELREKHGWVYGVECGYTQYSDSGIIAINLGCDKENLERCLAAVDKIIGGLKTRPLPEGRLRAFKKQLLGQLAIASDNGETQCLSMGKSMLAFGRVASDGENRAAVEAVSPTRLQELACRIFAEDKVSKLIFL